MNSRRNVTYLWSLPVLLTMTFLILPAAFRSYVSTPTPHTQAQRHVKEAVTPLCQALLPDQPSFALSILPYPLPSPGNATPNVWDVDCLDAHGEEKLRLRWSGDQQQVEMVYRLNVPVPPSWLSPLSQSQAIQLGRVWAERLSWAQTPQLQSCPVQVQHTATAWCVHLLLSDRKLTLCVDKITGDLRLAARQPALTPKGDASPLQH